MHPINKHTVLKKARENGFWAGFIAPSKVNSFHIAGGWHIGMQVKIIHDPGTKQYFYESYNGEKELLNDFLNGYMFYNCISELGRRVKYWEGVL